MNGTTDSADSNQVSALPTVVIKLAGTVIGTTGSFNNSGNTRDEVFDGNLTTYFDSANASGS